MIKVYTERKAAIGIHTVTVSVGLVSYTAITPTLSTFVIEIIGCVITGFTMINLSPMHDQTYTTTDPVKNWSLEGSSVTI